MRFGQLIVFPAVLAASLAAFPQTAPPAQKKASTFKKAAPKSAAKKTAHASATTVKTTGKTVARRKGKSAGRPVAKATSQPRQQTPTPERYKEIQQALVDKGYLKSEPSGVWDADSTEALRQFQTDRKLTATGKITASSLIGLGLGPRTAEPSPASLPGPATPPPAEPPKP
jgi:hypothetical protein